MHIHVKITGVHITLKHLCDGTIQQLVTHNIQGQNRCKVFLLSTQSLLTGGVSMVYIVRGMEATEHELVKV